MRWNRWQLCPSLPAQHHPLEPSVQAIRDAQCSCESHRPGGSPLRTGSLWKAREQQDDGVPESAAFMAVPSTAFTLIAPRNLPGSETPKCRTHFPICCSLNQPGSCRPTAGSLNPIPPSVGYCFTGLKSMQKQRALTTWAQSAYGSWSINAMGRFLFG